MSGLVIEYCICITATVTQQIEDAGTRHTEAKKTELDKFAGQLGDDLSAEVTQQTLAVKTQIDEHAGEFLKCTTMVFLFVKSGGLPIHVSSVKKELKAIVPRKIL